MSQTRLPGIMEAILFVAGEPVSLQEIAAALELPPEEVAAAADCLASDYDSQMRGLCLKRFRDHVQLATKPEYAPEIEKLLSPIQRQPLSQSALETLAVVAYRQPVTRLDVEAVRGVKCDYSLQSLTTKGFIREAGRKDSVGRPFLYETTDLFLSHFGLSSLEELPTLPTVGSDEEKKTGGSCC